MLSRDVCEALRALPEVRDHEGSNPDLYYLHREGKWQGPVLIDEWAWNLDEGFPMVWHPSLFDLLDIAAKDDPTVCLLRHFTPKPPGIALVWAFAGDLGRGPATDGETPDAAVAAWLLRRAGEGKADG